MLDQPHNLLIDIGNSRIKYALACAGQNDFEVLHCELIAELATVIQGVEKVVVASVGKALIIEELQTLCQQHQVECQVVQTQAEQFNIKCAYKQYSNMGVDRWLAVLAARKITDSPVAVLDLGTANTCDIIIGNQHIGGWIAPGFQMMKHALSNNTQKVFSDNNLPTGLTLGTSTPECVNLGCLAALQGFVTMAETQLASRAENYQIVITGGDQSLLAEIKQPNLHYFPNLVLLGLSRFLA